MRKEIDPAHTPRGKAFEFWMSSPMPMVTMTKTFDVSRLVKKSKKKKWKFNRRGFWRTTLPISFQFHHVQMDGGDAATFIELLQAIIKVI